MGNDYTNNNTNDENAKLENVKKSCKAAKICSKIIFVFMAVATVLTLFSGIVLVTNHDKYDEQIIAEAGKADFKKDLTIGSVKFASIDEGDIKMADSFKLESSVPALQQLFDENKDSYSMVIGFYLVGIAALCAIMAFTTWLISTVFDIILKEGNPFADKVPKRILISMIILTIVVSFIAGIGFAALLGLVTWAVYTIMDYGRMLRVQSDETL